MTNEVIFKSSYPFVAFPAWIFKKQLEEPEWLSCKEIALLLALQSFADGMRSDLSVHPSIERLCKMTAMSKRTIIDCIKQLQEKELIEKTTRYENGERKTNIYTLKLWNHAQPVVSEPSHLGAGSALTPDPKCKNRQTLGAGFAPKLEPLNNNHINPPISPRSAGEGRSATPETAARGSARFTAETKHIPFDLQNVADDVCAFFNSHKSGAKTKRAFDGLIKELLQIKLDKSGGIKAVQSQLAVAIKRSTMGEKKWASITYDNWQRFGQSNAGSSKFQSPQLPMISVAFAEDMV